MISVFGDAWWYEELERLRLAFAPSKLLDALPDGADVDRQMRALAASDPELARVAFGFDVRWRDMPAEDVPLLRRQA